MTGHQYPRTLGLERHVAQAQRHFAAALAPPQYALDAGQQFGRVEGLGQVVVGPHVEPQNLVVERVAGRDDNHVFALALLLQMFEQLQPVAVGQHDVEQNAVVGIGRQFGIGLGIVRSRLDHIALLCQCPLHNLPQGGFVFYNQYFHVSNLYI